MNSSTALNPKSAIKGLAARLIANGALGQYEAVEAERNAKAHRVSLVKYLIDTSVVEAKQLAQAASAEFGIPVFDLSAFNTRMLSSHQIDTELMIKCRAAPISRRGDRLFLAVSDPMNFRAIDEFKFASGINTEAILVEDQALHDLIAEFCAQSIDFETDISAMAAKDGAETMASDQAVPEKNIGEDIEHDAPTVRFVNKVLLDAINQGASDIHFEPDETEYRVRFRTDGILHEVVKPPRNLAPRLAARLKVMSQMDISERRVGRKFGHVGRDAGPRSNVQREN